MAEKTQTEEKTLQELQAEKAAAKPKTQQELQAEQAAARVAAAEAARPSAAAPPAVEEMSLEELAREVARHEDRLAELEAKVYKATERRNEIIAHIADLRQKLTNAQKLTFGEATRELLEGSKREYAARFQGAKRLQEAIKSLGTNEAMAMSTLGLGPSPIDQQIAKNLQANQRNHVIEKAVAAKNAGKQGG